MTNEQAQRLAEAIAATEYGKLVKSLLNRIDAGDMTLEELLQEVAQEKTS